LIVEVIMPKLGMYESDVTLIEWLVADGATVDVGEPLFLMETDKVETEIECEDAGILVTEAEAGYAAPIGSRIGYIASTDDERRQVLAQIGRG
jgi:pyruvate dehydrogenase E2 component (dihydrolipoamide acetyltransferase)